MEMGTNKIKSPNFKCNKQRTECVISYLHNKKTDITVQW